MRFSKVKELVSRAADYHARPATSYTELTGGPVSERVSMTQATQHTHPDLYAHRAEQ